MVHLHQNAIMLPLLLVAASHICIVSGNIQGEFERQHMNEAHQIEVTDEVTFFKLHDLDGDGFWDERELQSMYGLERDIDPNTSHIKLIIDRVYKEMDMNKDRYISQDEYITAKLPSLSEKEEKFEKKIKRNAPSPPKNSNKKKGKSSEKAKKAVQKETLGSMAAPGGIPNKYRA